MTNRPSPEADARRLVRFAELADRIAADIRTRKLRPGDAYLSTAEIARQFQVNGTTANKALQLLAQRRVLHRRQRAGAVVSDPSAAACALRHVHLLVHQAYLKTEGLTGDGMLIGLQGALPGAQVQFNFLPGIDEADYVRELIGRTLRSREPEGFVLMRASVDVQRLLSESGLPAVVLGSLHPSIAGLSQIDRDQRQLGRLLTEHLLARGAGRVAILLRERLSPGDHDLLDGACETLCEAGHSLADFTLRCLPADAAAAQAAAQSLLEGARRPLGCLCRTELLATGVQAAADALRLKGRKRPLITVADVYRRDDGEAPFVHARSTLDPEAIGRELGRMLLHKASHPRSPPESRAIGVEVVGG